MRDKKVYIVLLVILGVFFLVMFFTFGIGNIRQGKQSTTILIGDDTIWDYNKKKWLNLTTRSSIEKLAWKKFHVYLNNEEFGSYYLWHDDKWYAFDSKKNAVHLEGNFLAYRANYDMRILDFQEENIVDYTYVNTVLRENDLSISSQFTGSSKISIDFDDDGEKEDFYLISNAFPMDFEPEKIFSIVFMVKDEVIYYIYNDISDNRSFNGCKPYFTTFLDADNDNKLEFILSCGGYSTSKTVHMLYKYEQDAFKIVISN